MSHDELAELLGAYALDAVDVDEVGVIERHLQICPRCRAELRGHREVAGLLGHAGQEAPVGLWDRIVASTEETPPAMRVDHLHVIGGTPRAGTRPATGHGGRRIKARTVAVLGAAAAAVVAVLGVQVVRLDDRTSQMNRQIGVISATSGTPGLADVQRALKQPGTRQVRLASLGNNRPELTAVISPDGFGYVYASKLSPLPGDRTYQLWGIVGGDRISYGLLGNDPAGVVAFRAGTNVQAMAVTSEVAGGVESSTQPLVAVGSVA